MRQKKASIYISIVLAFFSLVLSIVFKYLLNAEFLSNVFLGVFGSAFAALVVFCYDYNTEKHKLIKEYCKKVHEIYHCRSRIFSIDEIDGKIPSIYYDKTENRSPIDRLCDIYIQMNSMRGQLVELYAEIDFFLDLPLKQWLQDRHLVYVGDSKKRLTREEKRIAKESAKARYRDEHYAGKRKEIIRKRIQDPLMRYLFTVSRFALNEFSWYREGLQADEETVVAGLLELQKECFAATENGSSTVPAEWHEASGELAGTLVGSRLFWIKEKANGHQKTD